MNNPLRTLFSSPDQQNDRLTIGFFATAIQHDWAFWPWQGIIEAARQHDVNVISFIGKVVGWPHDFYGQANALYALAGAERLDGLIIWASGVLTLLDEAERAAFCRQYDLPVVLMEGDVPGFPSITCDNYHGMHMAVEHLIEAHGYQRIGFLGLHEHHLAFQERYQAYVDVLTAHGLGLEPALIQQWIPPVEMSPVPRLRHTIGQWVQRAVAAGAEALIGACDMLAIHILYLLQEQGYRVPEDVAVIGFDDFIESRFLTPPLSTINPSWHAFGRSAIETLLNLLNEQPVPEQIVIPPRFMIRQSCGCLDAAVVQAGMITENEDTSSEASSPGEIMVHPQKLVADMLHAASHIVENEAYRDEIHSLLDAFIASITTGIHTDTYVSSINRLTNQVLAAAGDATLCHNLISALRAISLKWLHDADMRGKAETLWQQARIMIGQIAEHRNVALHLRAERQAEQLRDVGQRLITTFDLGELMDMLAEQLPELGIPGCYLSVFEDSPSYHYPAPPPRWSRLMLAYDRHGRILLESDGQRFPSRQLCPSQVFSQEHAVSLIAQPLYFREQQLGFVLFEVGHPDNGKIYETLRGLISSALQGDLLVQRIRKNADELAQKNAELIRNQYILDTFMANVPDGIYFKDRESRFTKTNQAHARRAGFDDPSEELGRSDFDYFPEEKARAKYTHEQEIIRTGKPLINLEEPENEGIWVLTTKMPLRDEHGEIIGTFGISRDITELKRIQSELENAYAEVEQRVKQRTAELHQEIAQRIRAEEALRTLNAELEQRVKERTADLEIANKELKDFAYAVSHDLKAPLRGIARLAYWLVEDYGQHFDEEGRNMAALLTERVKRMDKLIDGILQYSRVGRADTEEESVNLNELIPAVVENLSIPSHIHVSMVNEFPVVHYNMTRLFQVFQNLLSNAVKFLDKPHGKIHIGCEELEKTWQFSIIDNGPGIEECYHERIFNMFQTLNSYDQHESTGIGLALVKKIVGLYGGDVWVESTVGEGSTFWFTLPKT